MSPEASIGIPEVIQRRTYHKVVELISPERANELGIPAESPVFVSPYIKETKPCPHCSATYSPLVYQAGYTIFAQHMHDDIGGIYHYASERKGPPVSQDSNWIAVVEPLGDYQEEEGVGKGMDSIRVFRSPAIVVKGIRAYCTSTKGRNTKFHEIRSGIIAPNPPTRLFPNQPLQRKEFLKPLCSSHQGENIDPTFAFEISPTGEVWFAKPE